MNLCGGQRASIGWQGKVEKVCVDEGLHLTPLRRRVLSILDESPAAISAYAIIRELSRREGKQIAPTTVYRTLEFLLAHGFVHKIECQNVYAPCERPGHAHHGVLLLCEKCGRTGEIGDARLDRLLREMAARAGFAPRRQVFEIQGFCQACAAKGRDGVYGASDFFGEIGKSLVALD